jgi:hypothetical protein
MPAKSVAQKLFIKESHTILSINAASPLPFRERHVRVDAISNLLPEV